MTYAVTFKAGTSIQVTDAVGVDVEARWSGRVKSAPRITVPVIGADRPAKIELSSINGVWPDEVWQEMMHKKNGDWLCMQNFWHKRGEGCAHQPPKKPYAEPGQTILDRIDKPPSGKLSEKNWDVLRRNMAVMRRTGRYGTEGLEPEAIARREAFRAKVKAKQSKYKKLHPDRAKLVQRVHAAINPGDE